MTLLTIIQSVTDELELSAPSTVIGNTDAQVRQLLSLANRQGKLITWRHNLVELTVESTFTTVATESQGAITTHASGFQRFIPKTFWDRTNQEEVFGPIDEIDYQFMKANVITPSQPHYFLRGTTLFIYPAPAVSLSFAFSYRTKNWVTLASSGDADAFAADADTSKIPDDVMEAGLVWRWLKAAGVDYSEEFRTYEITLQNMALNNHARTRVINGGRSAPRSGEYSAVAAS